MAIQSRGARGQHLVTRGVVPVELVAQKVLETKDIDRVCAFYSLTQDEVFECVDFWADQHQPNTESYINIENYGDKNEISIGAKTISEDLWYNIIAYGRMFYPSESRINHLFQQGLRMVVLECYMDIYSGNTNYTHSDLHNIVFEAVVNAIGEPYTTEKALELLGVDEYMNINRELESEERRET